MEEPRCHALRATPSWAGLTPSRAQSTLTSWRKIRTRESTEEVVCSMKSRRNRKSVVFSVRITCITSHFPGMIFIFYMHLLSGTGTCVHQLVAGSRQCLSWVGGRVLDTNCVRLFVMCLCPRFRSLDGFGSGCCRIIMQLVQTYPTFCPVLRTLSNTWYIFLPASLRFCFFRSGTDHRQQ